MNRFDSVEALVDQLGKDVDADPGVLAGSSARPPRIGS